MYTFSGKTELPETFDPSQQKGSDFEPLPRDDYTVEIIEASIDEARNGSGLRANFTMRVVEGPREGRYIWHGITISNPSTQAVEIGKKQLKDLCNACGIKDVVQDIGVFLHIPIKVRVAIKIDPQGVYSDRNVVTRIVPLAAAAPNGSVNHGKPQPLSARLKDEISY
jgi:hypothetical protein